MKYILILKVVTSNSAMLYLELKSFPQKLLFEPSKSFRDAVLTRAFRRSFLITAKRDKRAKMYQKTYYHFLKDSLAAFFTDFVIDFFARLKKKIMDTFFGHI